MNPDPYTRSNKSNGGGGGLYGEYNIDDFIMGKR